MGSRRSKDELAVTVECVRAYCESKSLKVFPGFVDAEKVTSTRWRPAGPEEWRAFVDLAAALSAALIYLETSIFDEEDLDDARTRLAAREISDQDLEPFSAHVGETYWFQMGFFVGSVYHTYAETAEWWDAFVELSTPPSQAEPSDLDPALVAKWGEALARHERFAACRTAAQRTFLLQEIAEDALERLQVQGGISKVIATAERFFFINIQPQLDAKLKADAGALRKEGKSLAEIAGKLGVSREKIRSLVA